MLILSIVTTTLLLMMTQHRIWVFAGLGGAVCSWGLSQLVTIFERILPPDWHVFNGVFAFLVVAFVVLWLISLYERILPVRDET